MPYLLIKDFTSGLDTRKSLFTAPAGSVRKLENAHVTAGGEIEKRNALQVVADLPEGSHGLHAGNGRLTIFGSAPEPVEQLPAPLYYRQITPPDGMGPLAEVLDAETFGDGEYMIGRFTGGEIAHFYKGQRVTAWANLVSDASSNTDVVSLLAYRINQGSAFTATWQAEYRPSPQPNVPPRTITTLTVKEPTVGPGFTRVPSITGPVTNQRFLEIDARGGGASQPAERATGISRVPAYYPGHDREVTRIRVTRTSGAAVELLSTPVVIPAYILRPEPPYDYVPFTDHTERLNLLLSVLRPQLPAGWAAITPPDVPAPWYRLQAPAGSIWNGAVVEMWIRDYNINSNTWSEVTPYDDPNYFSGGKDAVTPTDPLEVTFEVDGTFSAALEYALTLDGVTFKVEPGTAKAGKLALTHDNRLYVVAGNLLLGSGFVDDEGHPDNRQPDPTRWINSPNTTGAVLIDVSMAASGVEELTALGTYQNQLAVLSGRTLQLWHTDPDPDQFQRLQTLANVGTRAPRSVVPYGDVDLFFLADTGVRSLRARHATGLGVTEDVGSPIDEELQRFLATLTDDEVAAAMGALEPRSGRYWLIVKDQAYVFSHFPNNRVAAWSRYHLPVAPTAVAVLDGYLYLRDATRLWRMSRTQFEESLVEVVTPFLDAEAPATEKMWLGLDLGVEGDWEVHVNFDPTRPDVYTFLTEVEGTSYGQQLSLPMEGCSTHVSLKLINRSDSYARLANIGIHYNSGEAN